MASKWTDRFFRPQDPELARLKSQVKQLTDRMEEVTIEDELKALATKYADETATGASPGDFSSIEEDISRAELQKLYTTESWFYIAVTCIANTIAALPTKLEQKRKTNTESGTVKESWSDASGEPEHQYFVYPNDIQPSIEFYKLLIIDLLTTGDAYMLVDHGQGASDVERRPQSRLQQALASPNVPSDVKGLYRLNSTMVEPIPSEDGKFIEGYGMQSAMGYFKFAPEEVIHLKLPNPVNPFHGLSPIVPVLKNVLIDRFTKEHFVRFYKQGARLGGVIQTDQKLTKEQITRLERTFESNYTGRQNHHRTAVLPAGMKYEIIQQDPGATSLIEFMRANKEPILAAFNVPPVKVGIMDGATFANALAQLEVYYTDTIMPVLTVIEQSINMHPTILKPERNLRFKFDLSDVDALKESDKDKADMAKSMIEAGLTVNEVRHRIWKLEPITGGDKSKVVESMGQSGGLAGFFGNAAPKPTAEKTEAPSSVQADPQAVDPSKPTNATFEERVAELAAAAVQQGIPIEQAIMAATIQTLAEGFAPVAPATVKPETGKDQITQQPAKEEVVAAASTQAPKLTVPNMTKEEMVQYWKDTTGEGVKSIMDQRRSEVESFFDRLEKVFLKGLQKALKKRGLQSAVQTKDMEVDDDEVGKFADDEAEKSLESGIKAFDKGYSKTLSQFKIDYSSEEVARILKEQAAEDITNVTQTTKDQIRRILSDGAKEGISVGEAASRIRDKFAQIKAGRAETIVRTEVLTAVSMGQDAKVQDFKKEYKDLADQLMKKWMSAQDDDVRDSHVDFDDMDPIAEDEEWSKGLMFPRDPDAELSERINCRCAQIVFLKQDQEDVEDVINEPSSLAD